MESPSEFYHKIEVLYMFSKGTGQGDHPHMIQVQYPSHQQAPTLRDVKSRLTALRGRGMPDSYAWSYKRSYNGTFIWCDVFDDDTILPLSKSGEYVLKALEVFDVSQDALGREEVQPCQEVVQSAMRILPTLNASGATVTTIKQEITQPDGVRDIGNIRNTASRNCSESKQKLFGSSGHAGNDTNASGNRRTDDCSTDTPTSASDDIVENKRCLEKFRRSGSSITTISASATNSSTGTQTEPSASSDDNSDVSSFKREVKLEVKGLPSGTLMRSADFEETSTRTFPSSEIFRRGPVKSRTWVVKEEDISAPTNVRNSRRSSEEFCEREPMVSTSRDIPSSPVVRPCFPGHPLTFMLKKAARFHRSQLCRRVEVVETFRALPLEEPSFSRYTSKSRNGIGSKKVPQKPHFSRIVTLKAKSQRNKMSSEEPQRESRSLSEFLETTKSRSSSERIVHESTRKAASARHNRSDSIHSKNVYGTARCREVVVGPKAVLLPERVPREDEKAMSDLKSLVKPDLKSFKTVTKSSVRQASQPGVQLSSSIFNPASGQALQLPTVYRPLEVNKNESLQQHKSLIAGFADRQTTDGSFIASEDSAWKPQDLKTLKVPRNVSKNCYFSLPLPGAEKKTSDTKIYPTRESSVFGPAENTHEVKMVNPKLEVQAALATETSYVAEGGSRWPKGSPPKHRGYKASTEERPLTPGLTELHWEGLLQEAVVHSHPPADLVLHECLRCGRTFKPDSLKVHLRGCHVNSKPKQSVVLRKRVAL